MHLKRLAAPAVFRITRKKERFAPRTIAGPHGLDRSIPLLLIVRDYLGYASTAVEAKKIIHKGNILIDRRVVKEPRFPVGLMDVVSIPLLNKHYRVLPEYKRGLQLREIGEGEANFKLGYIIRKQHVKGGGLQFTLHDGRNILFKQPTSEERAVAVGDTFKISLPDQSFMAHLPLEVGRYGLVIMGSKSGLHGRISKIDKTMKYPAKPLIQIDTPSGTVSTVLRYVMVIGDGGAWLSL